MMERFYQEFMANAREWLKHHKKLNAAFLVIVALLGISIYVGNVTESLDKTVMFYKKYIVKDIFFLRLAPYIKAKGYPNPLVYEYYSQLGKTLAPISLAIYVEVVNKKTVVNKLISYKVEALFQLPGEKKIQEWHSLTPLTIMGNNVYYMNTDWKNATIVGFNRNSLDTKASATMIEPDKSISGWLLFEFEPSIRDKDVEIIKFRFTLENSLGEKQEFVLPPVQSAHSLASGGVLNEGKTVLTGNYTVCSLADLYLYLDNMGKEK